MTTAAAPPAPTSVRLTLEQAQQILNCFGPCTTLYECKTAQDIVTQFKHGIGGDESNPLPFPNLKKFVKFLLDIEGIHTDRFLGGVADAGGNHASAVKSAQTAERAIIARLQASNLL